MKDIPLKKPTILIVDDEAYFVRLLKIILEDEGYETHYAYSGFEALEITKTEKIDLILLDIKMPGMTGFEVCEALNKEDVTRPIPIIFISSLNDRQSINKGFELGAYDFFTKPFNQIEVAVKISNCLKLKAVERNLNNEIAIREETEKVIRVISEETAGKTGLPFFNHLVVKMSEILDVDYVFTGEWKASKPDLITTFGACYKGNIIENFEYELQHTPCDNVLNRNICSYPSNIQEKFPKDHLLVDMGVESYIGIPLFGEGKKPLGLLVILHTKPIENVEYMESIVKAFSMRLSAELERKKVLEELEQREEMFHHAFHHAIIGRILADPVTGKVLWVNDYLCNLLGYSHQELLGESWMSLTHPEHLDETTKLVKKLIEQKIESFTLKQKGHTKGGELVWVTLNIVLIYDAEGQPKYLHGDIIDITKNREAERTLQMASDIVQNTLSGLHIYHLEDISDDASLRMIAANPASEKMTGVSPSDTIGKTLDENFPGLRAEGIPQKYAEVVRSQKPVAIEDITYGDDRVIEGAFSVNAFPLPNNQVGISFENITERKKSEQAILKESSINKIFSDLATALINPVKSMRDISEITLTFAKELTNSQQGIVSVINPENGDNVCYALTDLFGKDNFYQSDQPVLFPRGEDGKYNGLIGYALNTSKAYFTNAPEEHEAWTNRFPGKHFKIQQFLAVPAKVGRRLVGEIVLTNPGRDFTNQDLRTVRQLTKLFAVAVYRKEIEDALKESEERYRILAESTIEGILITDDTSVVDGNKQMFEMFGYEKSELIGRTYMDLLAPESHNLFRKKNLVHYKSPQEYKAIRKNGSVFPVMIWGKSIPYEGRKLSITSVRDITEQKEAERELKMSEKKFKTLFEYAPDSYYLHDLEGTYVDGNRAAETLTGYKKEELIGQNKFSLNLLSQDQLLRIAELLKLSAENKPTGPEEYVLNRKDGKQVDVEIRTYPLIIQGQKLVLGQARDITERKEMQRKILNTSIKAEERERRRFAQELHDGLGPLLSTAKLYIKSLETVEDIKKKNYATLKSVEIIDEAISTIREIANNISPHILKNFGLTVAVHSFIKQVNETNKIKIELKTDFSHRLAENIEITLFRILVELIHNTLKHANADYISIQMEVQKGVLAVDFKDNGCGFDYNKTMSELSGQGISNILNRIHSLNGKVKFNEQIEKGSRIQIEIKMMDN